MKIWAHTLVRNEEKYIWFAVMSIIDYVDKILIWDTGSEDSTPNVIKQIIKRKKDKVDFQELGAVNIHEFTKVRQKMLEKTTSDWFIVLDGDEVWWDVGISNLTRLIHSSADKLETVVNKYYSLAGDIFHYQEEKAGRYKIGSLSGHINIRATKRVIPGLHFEKPHGKLGLFDVDKRLIQERSSEKRAFQQTPAYLHFTNLQRSSKELDRKVPKRKSKFKHDLGIPFPKDFYYPEVFFKDKPKIVPNPWQKRSKSYNLKSSTLAPAKKIKRRIGFLNKSGY